MSLLLLFSGARQPSYTGTGPGPIGVAATAVKPPKGDAARLVPTAATASAPRPSR